MPHDRRCLAFNRVFQRSASAGAFEKPDAAFLSGRAIRGETAAPEQKSPPSITLEGFASLSL